MKKKRIDKPLLFVIPGALMLLAGFGILIASSLGDRLDALGASPLPFSAALVAVGAMLLTRTLLATFFLFAFSVTVIGLGIRDYGLLNPVLLPFVVLIFLCIPMAKYARR